MLRAGKDGLQQYSRLMNRNRGEITFLMATYLRYCDRFVTDDCAQEHTLREVAARAHTDSTVFVLRKFRDGFSVVIKKRGSISKG